MDWKWEVQGDRRRSVATLLVDAGLRRVTGEGSGRWRRSGHRRAHCSALVSLSFSYLQFLDRAKRRLARQACSGNSNAWALVCAQLKPETSPLGIEVVDDRMLRMTCVVAARSEGTSPLGSVSFGCSKQPAPAFCVAAVFGFALVEKPVVVECRLLGCLRRPGEAWGVPFYRRLKAAGAGLSGIPAIPLGSRFRLAPHFARHPDGLAHSARGPAMGCAVGGTAPWHRGDEPALEDRAGAGPSGRRGIRLRMLARARARSCDGRVPAGRSSSCSGASENTPGCCRPVSGTLPL